jgi:2-polyprenyl-6-methoxyphenol hydroxylase-like FAD-dependent oxidoreductase
MAFSGIASVERGLLAVSSLDDVDFRFDTKVVAASQSDDSVRLTTRGRDGHEEDLDVHALLGADGSRSVVADLFGIEKVSLAPSFKLALAAFEQPGSDVRAYRDVPAPDGSPLRVIRADAQHASVSFRVPAGIRLSNERRLRETLAVMGDLVGIRGPFANAPAIVNVRTRVATQVTNGRVLLGGDAIREFDPSHGFGLNAAMHDAARFGQFIEAVANRVPIHEAVRQYDEKTWEATDALLAHAAGSTTVLAPRAVSRLRQRLPRAWAAAIRSR